MAQHHSLVGKDLKAYGCTEHADVQTAPIKQTSFQSNSLSPTVSYAHKPFLPGNTMQDRHINKRNTNFSELFLCFKCLFSSCHRETRINQIFSPPCTHCLLSSMFNLSLWFASIFSLSLSSTCSCFPSNSHVPPHCKLDSLKTSM